MSNQDDLKEMLKIKNITKRPTVKALEEILYKPIQVLDHGFIRVVDYMGDSNAVVQAARVSYGHGTKKISQDKSLINYLIKNSHNTPLEMCDIKFHIKLPIFIARQWIRHRTASVNEYSARYSILSNEFYLPDRSQITAQSSTNKQGRNKLPLSDDTALKALTIIKEDSLRCYNNYIGMINEDASGNIIDKNNIGITRELARISLTLNHYTEWYWKINLHNLLHFLSLRLDSHAQYEIKVYAEAILEVVKAWVPFVYEAFKEHRLHGKSLSQTGIKIMRKMIKGEKVDQESSGMSKREWNELMEILNK